MALIKSNIAGDVLSGAIVLDLGDLRRQGEAMKQRAQAEADRIMAAGREEAAKLTAGAEARGFDAGFQKGHAAGLEAGRKQGHDQALRDSAAKLQRLDEAWVAAARQWDAERRAMLLEAKQSLLALAVAMAEKIVHRVPQVDPGVIADQVAAAIEHVARPCDVAVCVNPADRALVEAALPGIVRQARELEHVNLTEDAAVTAGGCVVTYGSGRIDATLQTQLAGLIDTMMPTRGHKSEDASQEAAEP